jgi:hypothetical protein
MKDDVLKIMGFDGVWSSNAGDLVTLQESMDIYEIYRAFCTFFYGI